MEIIYPRVAGIDVGKREIAVAVRTPGDVSGAAASTDPQVQDVLPGAAGMVAWLVEQGVTPCDDGSDRGVLEAGLSALCEAEQIEVLLVNAGT